MLINNPFSELFLAFPPLLIKCFVLAMILCVLFGTLIDLAHKKSAKYFFSNAEKEKKSKKHEISGGTMFSLILRTTLVEILSSGEFCNLRRRLAHLLTMYGFIGYALATAVMVFAYEGNEVVPDIFPILWHVGAAMICLGGYWFWFFIRVDLVAEGNSLFRFVRADLFVIALTGNATFGLIWSYMQLTGNVWDFLAFGLYLISATVLFGSVPWSKFSHMFYKPAAAIQKNVAMANGSRRNLPVPSDRPAILGKPERNTSNY